MKKEISDRIFEANALISMLKLKLGSEGTETIVIYGEGVGQIAGLLSQRFGVSVTDALIGKNLRRQELEEAVRDLEWALTKSGPMLRSEVQAVRTTGHQNVVGSLILYHPYLMRIASRYGSRNQQLEAEAVADRLAEFSRTMAEIGAGTREPNDALQ